MGRGAITYDDANLQRLFAEMDVKQRLQALKGAFRREANQVRKTAVNNLRGSINSNAMLDKGIRAFVLKRAAGFTVTVAPKKTAKKQVESYAAGRRRRLKEYGLVDLWAETGTKERKTKTKTKCWVRERKGHTTGRMKRYGFMRQTASQVKDSVTEHLRIELMNNVQKIANKYGCE